MASAVEITGEPQIQLTLTQAEAEALSFLVDEAVVWRLSDPTFRAIHDALAVISPDFNFGQGGEFTFDAAYEGGTALRVARVSA